MRYGSPDSIFVLYRSRLNQFFLHQHGHTWPASREQVAKRFGSIFADSIQFHAADIWTKYDDDARAEVAAIQAARDRYEAVGVAQDSSWDGSPLYGVWDHTDGRLMLGYSTSFEGALLYIDEINNSPCRIGEEMYIHPAVKFPKDRELDALVPALEVPSVQARLAAYNVAVVDRIAELMR